MAYPPDHFTEEMASFPIEGNIIDHTWPFIVTTLSGKPDTRAVFILAYLYSIPNISEIYIETSYGLLMDITGSNKLQIRKAFANLERLGFCDINKKNKRSKNLFVRLNKRELSDRRMDFLRTRSL